MPNLTMKQALQIDSPERSFVTFLQNLVAQDGIISTVFVNATMAKNPSDHLLTIT